jgi:prephenate dehydrogenase
LKIAIIGGDGKMGRWFADFLLDEGNEVIITGQDQKKLVETGRLLGAEVASNEQAVKSADAVVISVPIDSFEEAVKQISPHARPGQIFMDITSVKVMPVNAMHQYLPQSLVLGTHPVFGPGAHNLANQNFVLTPTGREEKALAKKVQQYLEERGSRVTAISPAAHDEMMAVVLGLAHFISIVSADTIASAKRFPLLKAIGGTTYRVLLALVESVISEDPQLYAAIQMNIPDMVKVEASFQRNAREWSRLVKKADREGFIAKMTAVSQKLEKANPEFGKAYRNIYKITEWL